MIKVPVNEFRGYADEVFGPVEGKAVYEFYRDILQLGKNQSADKAKHGFQKKKYESPTSRRLKHIQFLVDEYGCEAISSARKLFTEKLNHGEIDEPTINYFTGFVRNEAIRLDKEATKLKADSTKSSAAPITKVDTAIVASVIPGPKCFVEDMGKDDKIMDWDFTCKCGAVIPGHTPSCPNCNAKLDWEKVDKSKLI